MTIRPATEADYPAAFRLFRVLMGENFDLDQSLFNEVCHNVGHVAFVAETGAAEVGGILTAVVNDRIRLAANAKRRRFHIEQLIVFPEHRRKGVGSALLNHLKEIARAQAPAYVIVNCDFTDVAARRTYEAAEFHLVRANSDRFEIAFS